MFDRGFLRGAALSLGMFVTLHGCKNRIESGPVSTAPASAPGGQPLPPQGQPPPQGQQQQPGAVAGAPGAAPPAARPPNQAPARAAPRPAPKPAVSALGRNKKCGEASYYADSLGGNPTASGEIYSPGKLTAAHLTLPLHTKVTVTLEGNESKRVELKVNDRGPYGDSRRILDLSRAAFEKLGSTSRGVLDICMHWN